MAPVRVHTSSSMTRLAAALGEDLAAAPLSPLEREAVVVLSNGMGRWLSLQLATQLGVCAGMEFRFPNDTLDACFRAAIPDLPHQSPYTLDTMAWRIAGLLPDYLDQPGFEAVAAYLGDRSDDRRLLQFSRILADCFDQYTIFRPRMVLRWDAGGDNDWQAVLWRALTARAPGMHRAALLQTFRRRLATGKIPATMFPRRISLFGISFLPPFHLDFLAALAGVTEVTIYLFNPCGGYWGDLYSERRRIELALEQELPPEALEFYETGNPLLSSLGTQGQEFFSQLLDLDTEWNDLDEGITTEAASLLGTVQNDILRLIDRGATAPQVPVPAHDRSVQIHSCHGPLREMEILYDNLLRMFEEFPDLEPRDICVMTPDIGSYAPYIAATFGTRCGGRPAIPFTIADQGQRRENPLINTFLRMLELPAGRFGINAMLELLECPQVMARFSIDPAELDLIRGWLPESGVRWGIDARHRESLGFPPYGDFSWQAGMDRLLLGYAMAPEGDRLFAGILPGAMGGGIQSQALGKLSAFVHAARSLATQLAGKQTLTAWADILIGLAGRMLAPLDGNDTAAAPLYGAFQTLRDIADRTGFSIPLSLEGVVDTLKGLLDTSGGSSGFLGGRVTFCAMLPMRSIPQRVICLVGMNDGAFPRSQRLPAFSRLNGARRRGDRSLRDEDRYLFLEALLSAGETLYISYTGQSDRDNTALPPSVLVSELLDCVRRGFHAVGAPDSPPDIVTAHRLQPFSEEYFTDAAGSRLFSYSPEILQALRARTDSGQPDRAFITSPLPEETDLPMTLDLRDLIVFLRNPAKAFLSQRMKVVPRGIADELEEREPFTLNTLASYSLRQELTARLLAGEACDDLSTAFAARGMLPPLAAGQAAYEAALAESTAFAARITPELGGILPPLSFELPLGGTLLTGTLRDVNIGRHLRWRCASLKGTDLLPIWCEHLVLNAIGAAGYPRQSLLICKDKTVVLPPLDNGAELLAGLVDLYREGMRRPVHFFPHASWLYLDKGPGAAEGRWLGTDFSQAPAEAADPANELCFSGITPLDDEFRELAVRVFAPLRDAASRAGEP